MNSPLKLTKPTSRPTMNTVEEHIRAEAIVTKVALRIAPAFEIRDMVAVNPFLGYSEFSFLETSDLVERIFHTDILPDRLALAASYQAGEFSDGDLVSALAEFGSDSGGINETELIRYLSSANGPPPQGGRIEANLDQLALGGGHLLATGLLQSVTRYLAARYDLTIAKWQPERATSLFEGYLKYASRDRSPEILGLRGFRKRAAETEAEPLGFLASTISRYELDEETAALYFGRLLAKLNGWASFLRQEAWQTGPGATGALPELLAILAFIDTSPGALDGFKGSPRSIPPELGAEKERKLRLIALRAKERAFVRGVVHKFVKVEPRKTPPAVQAVFCIDVRSERFRRHLESVDPTVETYGFAGFFGLPVSFSTPERDAAPHCPPLLRPALDLKVVSENGKKSSEPEAPSFVERLKSGPIGSLSLVESLGFGYGVSLVRDALAREVERPHEESSLDLGGLALDARVRFASGILKNLGLRRPLAKVVFLVGHDSRVSNNPQKAGLSCGACAGHGGDKNALLACLLLNDAEVREQLVKQGTIIPPDTLFVPALHETTTDRIEVVSPSLLPVTHRKEVARVLEWFELAGDAVRRERAATLLDESAPLLDAFLARSASVSEVRPEWALAGNAAFIVARRDRTRSVDLAGRSFLHSYDEERDLDGSVLELILSAPAVVGSWINLQYYASSVAPRCFGSGTKTLHNVVGGFAVMEGNDGDLAVGLSLESVANGAKFRHEPLRLQLIVEASEARIDEIVHNHQGFGDLVRGEWIALYSLERDSNTLKKYHPRYGFSDPSFEAEIHP